MMKKKDEKCEANEEGKKKKNEKQCMRLSSSVSYQMAFLCECYEIIK